MVPGSVALKLTCEGSLLQAESPKIRHPDMAEQNSESCSRCGASFVSGDSSAASSKLCHSCRTIASSGTVRGGASVVIGSTAQPTVFPDDPAAPIYSGKTVEREADPHATVLFSSQQEAAAKASIIVLEKGDRLGRFEIIKVLGRGSFGTVYRGHDPILDRDVAIKVPRFSNDDKDEYDRFLQEAKSAAKLKHPNIVAVFESGEDKGQPFIVAELVVGTTLAEILREGRLDILQGVNWIQQIAEALEYAHSEGIVHRDVKPGNVMVTANGRPQLMDFGLAIRLDKTVASSLDEKIVGTPAYMPPEQARGDHDKVGPLSDQYSVGAMFYELLTRRAPYSGRLWTVVNQVSDLKMQPPVPSRLRDDIPEDLEAACLKVMQKDPQDRYKNLKEFAEDLERWKDGRPLLARPVGPVERAARWCRRNRFSAALLSVIAIFIAVSVIASYVMTYQFQQLAEAANQKATEANDARVKESDALHRESEAREQEKLARLGTERLLIETYSEAALVADNAGDSRQSMLWLGNAVNAAGNHQDLEQLNRRRFGAWSNSVAIPVHAHKAPGTWCRSLKFHPSNRYLMTEASGHNVEIWDLSNDQAFPLPIEGNIDAATWNEDGTLLALADGTTASVFEFPSGREIDCFQLTGEISVLQFAPVASQLAIGGATHVVVRDFRSKSDVMTPLPVANGTKSVAWSPDAKHLAVLSGDQQARVFAVEAGSKKQAPVLPALSAKCEVFFNIQFISNSRVVVSDNYRAITCWDLESKAVVWERVVAAVTSWAVSKQRDLLAYGQGFDVYVLNAENGEQRAKQAHRNLIYNCEFSPNGRWLISGGGDQTEKILDVLTGETILDNIPHTDVVHRAAWTSDSKFVATSHWGVPFVRVWRCGPLAESNFSAETGSTQTFFKIDSEGQRVLPVGFDGKRAQRYLMQVRLGDGQSQGVATKLTANIINDAADVPRSNNIIVVSSPSKEDNGLSAESLAEPGVIQILDRETGKEVLPSIETASAPIAVDVSRDGTVAAVLCNARRLMMVDMVTGKLRWDIPVFDSETMAHLFLIRRRVKFASAGDRLLIWGAGKSAEMRDSQTGDLVFKVAHSTGYIHDAVFCPNGRLFITCGSDQMARQWKITDGSMAGPDLKHGGWVFTGQFTKDGKRFLTASSDRHARVWTVNSGQVSASTREHKDEIYAVAFDRDETSFITGTRNGSVRIWDVAQARQIGSDRKLPDQVYQLAVTPDGSRFIASGRFPSITSLSTQTQAAMSYEKYSGEMLKTLGELSASQSLYSEGAPVNLTTDEWMTRWARIKELQRIR